MAADDSTEDGSLLPEAYTPRDIFKPLHDCDHRWKVAVSHRRAGKTVACVQQLIAKAEKCSLAHPRFVYVAPQLNQAKDIAWTYLQEFTRRFDGLRLSATELWVELPVNDARIRIYGADNPDRLRGMYVDGAVLDEYGDMDPQVWSQVIRPALSDRGGWAVFIGTPKGKNDFFRIWSAADKDSRWLRLTHKASETGLLDAEELADAHRAMSDDDYAQEYECSFEAAVRGAYYAKELIQAEKEGRITSVPHDPSLLVHTAWDLGIADSTVIWFIQMIGRETRIIDVLRGDGVGLDWYAKRLQERDWAWGNHYLPHDVKVNELGTGKSRLEILEGLGIRSLIAPNLSVADGIQALRMLLPMCWFDADKCADGLEALRMYRREWDDRRQEFQNRPRHDYTSHYADALRMFAVAHRERKAPPPKRKRNSKWVA